MMSRRRTSPRVTWRCTSGRSFGGLSFRRPT
ncbi:unnamed protein product [Linum tenue]|uniref:Uncharacterized protein n=1 Tax=Linum tenue TaxID=586396 RepID=A0AAV0HQS4_9ROSI|nr:unnamed protein product [Linum tenue]